MMERVAIVTGGAGTLGSAICTELVSRGNRVIIAYRSQGRSARQLASQLGKAYAYAANADLTQESAANSLVDAAADHFGSASILVNNAGVMTNTLVEQMSDQEWSHSLEVNLTSAFRMVRAAIPGMKASGWGRIINVSSQAAYRGSAGRAHYAAAKAGILGLTYSLARELGPNGITVNAVVPGRFRSEMVSPSSPRQEADWLTATPLRRFGEPHELASVVGFLSSPEAAYVTGSAIHVGGGLVMG